MHSPPPLPSLTAADLRDLARAKALLEHPGLTARLAHAVGRPIERSLELLPAPATRLVHRATKAALLKALSVAVGSLGRRGTRGSGETWHKFLAGATGGIGGAFGLATLPVELPVSTTIMLRSIAAIARSEGHDLDAIETRLACLEVFAFGGRSSADNAAESAYWAVRAGLAKAVSEAATYLMQKGLLEEGAPAVVRLVAAIAARFGVVVSEQVAAKAVPVVGAAGGSLVNVLFLNHFQDVARGHFIVKRLEARHGSDAVRAAYERLS